MTLGEVKDIVREHFARTTMPTTMLDQALAEGRRIVESHANFWWMIDSVDFTAIIGNSEYNIIDPVGEIAVPTFKDGRALSWRVSGAKRWQPIDAFGTSTREEIDVEFDEDKSSTPEVALIEDNTLYVYPPPAAAYEFRFYIWVNTLNPENNLETDELLTASPMTLVYAALVWGYEQQLKDFNGASYWRQLLGGVPFGRSGKLALLKEENFRRAFKDKGEFIPFVGPRNARRNQTYRSYRY